MVRGSSVMVRTVLGDGQGELGDGQEGELGDGQEGAE